MFTLPLVDPPVDASPIDAILCGMAKQTIETSLGSIWIEDLSSGEMRIWWPYGCRAGELAVGILEGKARWHPRSKGWYVASARRDEIYEALAAL